MKGLSRKRINYCLRKGHPIYLITGFLYYRGHHLMDFYMGHKYLHVKAHLERCVHM